VDAIRHRVPFQQHDVFLTAQLPQNLPDLATSACKKLLLPVFWYQHRMVLAVPLHMGLTTPIFHSQSSLTPRGLPQGGFFHIHAGNGRAFTLLTGIAGGLTMI
jgi:hypothetical protein